MSTIRQNSTASVLNIRTFLGLNESPDGDTGLAPGELAEMRSFRITQEGHLQLRPGRKTLLHLREAWEHWAAERAGAVESPRFCGAWCGNLRGEEVLLAAYGGAVWRIDPAAPAAVCVGACTQDETAFFAFGGKVYLLNGHEYLGWDGGEDGFAEVEGYIPTVLTAANPSGAGTPLENVNRLTGKRRVRFSPDGAATAFHLPETADEILSVEGTDLDWEDDGGAVIFSAPPAAGTNTLTVTYRCGSGERDAVTAMRFAEIGGGPTDVRVFLYGDGGNKILYSGVTHEGGAPSAEYFPDLYEAAIGDGSRPVTAVVRHRARLLAFTDGSAWSMECLLLDAEGAGGTVPAFYITPVNRQLGNEAPGQVQLLENDPLTLENGAVYRWQSGSGGYVTADERSARRISDRVRRTLASFAAADCRTFDHAAESEFFFLCGTQALIYNYARDVWYRYDDFPARCLLETTAGLLAFTAGGAVESVSREYRSDDGEPIDAYAATGAMALTHGWLRKYSPRVYLTMKPERGARITVAACDDRGGETALTAACGLADFQNVHFGCFSFATAARPAVQRLRLKVKKTAFYRLVFKSCSASATATVLETAVDFHSTGTMK